MDQPPRFKKLAKATFVGLLGIGLLSGTATLGGWSETRNIVQTPTTITAGEIQLKNNSDNAWTLNGTPVDSDLTSVRLVPGDELLYTGTSTPTITGALTAYVYFTGVDATMGALANHPAATASWSIGGVQAVKTLTKADSGVPVATSFAVTMAPVGDPVYASGNEAEGLMMDISGVRVAVSMNAPAGAGQPTAPEGAVAPGALWVIEDDKVREAVIASLGVSDPSEITTASMKSFSTISVTDVTADTDLSALREMPNLRSVTLQGWGDFDGDALASLTEATQIENLTLYMERITDVTKVADLDWIKTLEMQAYEVSDLAPLAKMSLESLDLSYMDNLTSIEPLRAMSTLRTLDISHTYNLLDLSPIEGLDLTKMTLDGIGATDYSVIASQRNLMHLTVLGTGLESLAGFGSLSKLVDLSVNSYKVTDLTPISDLKLSELYVDHTGVSTLAPLSSMTTLARVGASNTALTDITALSGATKLSDLDMSQTPVADIGALAGATSLTKLNINNTAVTDLTPLSGLTELSSLSISVTSVSDVSPLRGLMKLKVLEAGYTLVTDWSPVSHVQNVYK